MIAMIIKSLFCIALKECLMKSVAPAGQHRLIRLLQETDYKKFTCIGFSLFVEGFRRVLPVKWSSMATLR